ncbi:DUF7159 family protein [Mycobacterium sp. ML1]
MDVVLGVSMAPSAVRMALVEGEDADGVIVEEDSFRLPRETAATCASDRVMAAILGTREGAGEAGLRLSSVGVCWTDQTQAAALRDALAAHKVDNVMLVSAFLAAVAMGQAVGAAVGYERTGVLFVEPESATLAVVDNQDGSLCDVLNQPLDEDDDAAVAELAQLVSTAESMRPRPDGLYVVGSGVDVPMIKPVLDAATTLTISVPEEPEMALARGAALASGSSPLFAASTAALAYAQDFDDINDVSGFADSDVADEDTGRRRPALLLGSGLAVVACAAAVALEVALAITIRPTVALQPKPNENHFVAPMEPAPAAPEVAAPQHKIDVPAAPHAEIPQRPAPAAAAPAEPARVAPVIPVPAPAAPPVRVPALPAPRVPDPVVLPPAIPNLVPRAPVAQVPVQVPRQQPQLPVPRAPVPATPPRVENPIPRVPIIQLPQAPVPSPGRGPFGGGPGGQGPFGGDGPGGHGPVGGRGPGGQGPFGGGGPGGHGPFGGGGGGPGIQGPFGGGGAGGHGPFGGGPGGGRGGFGGGGGGFGGGHGGGGGRH